MNDQRACVVCETPFTPRSSLQKLCSRECRLERQRKLARERYHNDPVYRERALQRSRDDWADPDFRRHQREYNREYRRNRYQNDPDYRRRTLERNREWERKRRRGESEC